MSEKPLSLDAEGVNALLRRAFSDAPPERLPQVVEVEHGRLLLRQTFRPEMLRPGGVVSGPTLMSCADVAAYALLLTHVGPELMAVTSSLTMHFLRGAAPGELYAEAALLRLGRRSMVSDVRLWTEGRERLAAHATVTYARPSA